MRSNMIRMTAAVLLVALLVVSVALVGCAAPPATTPTGTSVSPSTGTSEGAEGQNVQQAPGEESATVETTVP
jgi:hypothetical protein